MPRRTGPRTGGVQATMNAFRDEIASVAAEKLEGRLKDISRFATSVSPVDTGAYVTSFSIGRAGFGGGRMKTSDNKPRNQNPESMKAEGYGLLLSDIESMDVKSMVESGNVKFTLRNRSTHARDVEDGENWKKDGYHVFAKIRNGFG